MFAAIEVYIKPTQSSKYNMFSEKTYIETKDKNDII